MKKYFSIDKTNDDTSLLSPCGRGSKNLDLTFFRNLRSSWRTKVKSLVFAGEGSNLKAYDKPAQSQRQKLSIIGCLIVALLVSFPVHAADAESPDEAKGPSGLPLPRFASLRSDEVNLRTGPGTRYPIDWVFVAKGLPVEITAEFEVWRRVRDSEGTEGWIHKTGLSGKRTAIVTKTMRELREAEDPQSPILARLEPGALGQILACSPEWCRVKFGDIKGHLRKADFWGVYPQETFN